MLQSEEEVVKLCETLISEDMGSEAYIRFAEILIETKIRKAKKKTYKKVSVSSPERFRYSSPEDSSSCPLPARSLLFLCQ